MIDIPIGKALVAVEYTEPDNGLYMPLYLCRECIFYLGSGNRGCSYSNKRHILCSRFDRKDGKNVIFKLVDLREEYNRGYADGHAACSGGEEV